MPRPVLSAEQRAAAARRARSAILQAMAQRLAEAGFHGTSIADLTRIARVSNSTLYALFEDKEAIFIALYEQLNRSLRDVVDEAVQASRNSGAGWPAQLRTGIDSYLRTMLAGDRLTWCLLAEATSISPRTQAARREAFDRYADMLIGYANHVAADDGFLVRVTPELTIAAIGGMNELLLREMESQTDDVESLVDTATGIFSALFRASWLPRG